MKFKFFFGVILSLSISLNAWSYDDFSGLAPRAADNLIVDTQYLNDMANLVLQDVEKKTSDRPSVESLKGIQKTIRQASYVLAQSSAFTEAMLTASFIKYPDALKVNIGLNVVTLLLFPVLMYAGHPALASALHFPGVESTLTAAYVLTRKWNEKRSLKKRLGLDLSEITKFKLEFYSEESLKSVSLHAIPDSLANDIENIVVPVARGSMFKSKPAPSSKYISINELEKMINNPEFLNAARTLNLEPSLYSELLIQKILSEPSLSEPFLTRVKSLNLSDQSGWNQWADDTEAFLNRIRAEAMLQSFDMKKLLHAGRLEYFKSYRSGSKDRAKLYSQIRDLELFQIETISAVIQKENIDISEAYSKFNSMRVELINGFSAYETLYPTIASKYVFETMSPSAMVCRDLFAM